MLISVALGQVLSLLICGIGLTSKYLSEDFHANTPVFQSFLNYILLFLVYTTTLAVRQDQAVAAAWLLGFREADQLAILMVTDDFQDPQRSPVPVVITRLTQVPSLQSGHCIFQSTRLQSHTILEKLIHGAGRRITICAISNSPRVLEGSTGEENLLAILRHRWWKYMVLGLIDLEANYLVVKAYQYTTLTSIQAEVRSERPEWANAALDGHQLCCQRGSLAWHRSSSTSEGSEAEAGQEACPEAMIDHVTTRNDSAALTPPSICSCRTQPSGQCCPSSRLAVARPPWVALLQPGWACSVAVISTVSSPVEAQFPLLDCFVIPVVILLSWFFLLVRYKAVHFLGIVVCILGMGCMVGADVLVGRHQGAGENKLVGDLLVLGGATLYGISNVWEEYIIRTLSRVEFLGMIGLFGAFFSGIQLAIMEHKELLKVPWDWQIGLLYVSFSACMFGLYSFMPVVIKKTSATAVNLSLLTADLYSLFCGLFLFHYKFSGLYLLSFFTILIGLVLYSSTSTYIAQDPRVYKQFRNPAGPAVDLPAAAQVEPSVTYTSLGQETEEEPHVHMA
ncbi:Solute carrier family 35 member F1 [Fukomys damarensis]|uniref:Solute carrier family 35 member F1 n=1 Tax=Fukomys damarensis TaxID=885580 RepID=A0A091DNQ9_FUKDA|nr:Solute carrier family 35 member F1 [Fukomys damarensis]